jgi:hypothetical protein
MPSPHPELILCLGSPARRHHHRRTNSNRVGNRRRFRGPHPYLDISRYSGFLGTTDCYRLSRGRCGWFVDASGTPDSGTSVQEGRAIVWGYLLGRHGLDC